MKSLQFLILLIILSVIGNVLTLNITDKRLSGGLSGPDNNTLCAHDKICIMKCCPTGTYFGIKMVPGVNRIRKMRVCEFYNETKDLLSFATDADGRFTHPNMSIFEVKSGIFLKNDLFRRMSQDTFNFTHFLGHLTEKAQLDLQHYNAYNQWRHFKNDRFCWDYKILSNTTNNVTTKYLDPGLWVYFDDDAEEPSRTSTTIMTTAMLISCFFLLVVLVVYGLLPELRNLCGMILMAYVGSQLVAFFLLAVIRIRTHPVPVCISLTMFIYFFFLASFCWMNVMSYDIWWTFRGYAKARPIHRRGEPFKFMMYCLYAWGLPLVMTIGLHILNNANMRHYPWFVTPKIPTNGCFIEDGEKYLYLYIPMMILILCNWMFYLMTAFNVWRLSRGTAVLDSAAAGTPQAHRTQRQRFMVYLKLSIVMGLNWLLEVVSFKYPKNYLWVISDFYNILIGVSIFLIFVCKPKILKKLTKVYLRCKKSNWRPGQMNSTRSASSTDSGSSQETQSLHVSPNPKGLPLYNVNKSF